MKAIYSWSCVESNHQYTENGNRRESATEATTVTLVSTGN